MRSKPVAAGKTAPRLIEDLLEYDPVRLSANVLNLLADLPSTSRDVSRRRTGIPSGSCRHRYMLKPSQSKLPPVDSQPGSAPFAKVAAFCSECRCHLDITLEIDLSRQDASPCPTEEYPLHHFRHIESLSEMQKAASRLSRGERWLDQQTFVCTAPSCCAALSVVIYGPCLTPDFVSLLTDPRLINERAQSACQSYPDRFPTGPKIPDPVNVMKIMRKILKDSQQATKSIQISSENESFLINLGESCSELLVYLGLQKVGVDTDPGKAPRTAWRLPQVHANDSSPVYTDRGDKTIDDAENEIFALLAKRPADDLVHHKVILEPQLENALRYIQRCLGSLDYERVSSATRNVDLTIQEDPAYARLGALGDFSNRLLIFAYERQRTTDPENASYYFDCLRALTKQRDSEELDTQIALIESSGQVSQLDIDRAYEYLGIEPRSRGIADEHVIGTFQARLSDAPRQAAEMRHHLAVIGIARNSEAIKSVASNNVTTYEEALTWLGAQDTTADEWVISFLTAKLAEPNVDEKVGREAVRIIAEKRNSDALRSWLSTGELGLDMDIGEAYRRFGIEDRTVDDDLIITTFQIRVSEEPLHVEQLRTALQVIAKETGSVKIASFLSTGQATESGSSDWPVGLENIGNTCYLNSLLQFYFTVRPLRDLILRYKEIEADVSPQSIDKKRVGSRKVSLKEVERAKKFAYELQGLFKTLITAQASSITPARELARLTLIKSGDEERIRRRSTLGSTIRPSLGEVDSIAVQGPLPRPQTPHELEMDTEAAGPLPEQNASDDSDKTLVEEPQGPLMPDTPMGDAEADVDLHDTTTHADSSYSNFVMVDAEEKAAQGEILEDKENMPPSKSEGTEGPHIHTHAEPLEEVSESRVNEQPRHTRPDRGDKESPDVVMSNGEQAHQSVELHGNPPDRPPPVPPRPKQTEESRRPVDELELGAQQDVTEVIGNVMFQLECAIRPLGIDDGGEQIDEIKQLFYGKQKTYLETGSAVRSSEEYFADIKVNVAGGPRDIYSALDEAFDVQEVTLEEAKCPQYASISQLPPILQIQVQRVQYDVEKKNSYKSEAHLALRETIYLDRYVESDDPELIRKRQESWIWKEKLKLLGARRELLSKSEVDMNIPEMIGALNKWLREVDHQEYNSPIGSDPITVDTSLTESLDSIAQRVSTSLEDIEVEIVDLESKLSNQFKDMQRLPYRLQSVFIHRGTATFGHYWIYTYDFARKLWRKYNDGYVTEVKDEREIYEQEPRYPATPYYLVYVRDDAKRDLVDPVCRDILVPSPSASASASGWQQPNVSTATGSTTTATNPVHAQGGMANAISAAAAGTPANEFVLAGRPEPVDTDADAALRQGSRKQQQQQQQRQDQVDGGGGTTNSDLWSVSYPGDTPFVDHGGHDRDGAFW
ncbi:MAG: hypothetical protein M1825_005067 [Sarcosagium campestre]|nr:MAG: hypothetical protein M1825_005067 [Sarcosagium campestre]